MIEKLLVILLTIPIIDSTLKLNIYRAHNLPAIPPGHKIATKYLLEGDYFAIGKHGVYALHCLTNSPSRFAWRVI